MPVFSVEQIAKAAGKDTTTVRRWCALGFVPGANRKRGGKRRHWRIEGNNALTIAGLTLRAARSVGHLRKRKRTIGGLVVPREMLERVERMKARLRRKRDPALVLGAWAAARGESFDYGELTYDLLMRGNRAEMLAAALAVGIIESGASKDAAAVLGLRFGWSRATFYRKFGNLLPMAKRIADEFNQTDAPATSREWSKDNNSGAGGYSRVAFTIDESILSPEQIRCFNSMASSPLGSAG